MAKKRKDEEDFTTSFFNNLNNSNLPANNDSFDTFMNRMDTSRAYVNQVTSPEYKKQQELLKQQQGNSGFFKGGSSNFLEGYANTMWDLSADIGQGFFRTLEGIADWGQYRISDAANFWSNLGKSAFGENNLFSDVTSAYGDWWKENAKFESTASLFGTNENAQQTLFGNQWRNELNEKSYLGDMGDSIGEGIGNIAAMAGVGAVLTPVAGGLGLTTEAGTLSTGGKLFVSGLSSYSSAYGNARSEAYKNGATDDEANKSGIINGLAEAVSEQFFDSMPGIKSAGLAERIGVKDFLANKIKKGIGNNTAKVFLKLVGGFEEGAEEMISNALVAVGNDIMHALDENYNYGMENQTGDILQDFKNAFVSEDSLKSFISAGFTSAILGYGGDILTTAQRNQVINAFAKDNDMTFKDAKALLNGENLSQAEQQVQREVQSGRGEINNDIELEEAARERIINYMKSKQGRNIESRIEDLVREEARNKGVEYTPQQLKQEADKIRAELIDQTNNPERYRVFEQEATNERDSELIKSFKDAKANDSQEAHKMYNFVKKLQDSNPNAKYRIVSNETLKDMGVDGRQVNGYNKDGVVYINIDSKNAYEQVAYHEIAHSIKDSSPELYNELKNLVYELKGKNGLDEYRKLYRVEDGQLASQLTDNVEDEYVNDKLGEILNDDKYINNLTENRSILQKLIDEIKKFLKYMTSGKEQKQLMQVQEKLEKAYKQGYKEAEFKGTTNYEIAQEQKKRVQEEQEQVQEQEEVPFFEAGEEVEEDVPFYYSLSQDSNGKELTKEQQEYFKDSKVRDKDGRLLEVYHGTPNAGFTIYDNTRLGETSGADDTTLGFHLTDNVELASFFSGIVGDEAYNEAKQEINAKYNISEGEIIPFEAQAQINQEIEELAEEKAKQKGEVKHQYINITKPLSIFADYGIDETQLARDLVYAATGEEDISNVTDYYETNEEFLSAIQQNFDDELAQLKDELAKPESIERIKEMGYDGLILPMTNKDKATIKGNGTEYVVFNSNQIKNTDNTTPTIDQDIRYSLTKASPEQREQANKLEEQGKSVEDIYLETGIYRGADGLWRSEIDDSDAKIKIDLAIKPGRDGLRYKLKDILDHDKLYEAYPEFKELNVIIKDLPDTYNGFVDSDGDIYIDTSNYDYEQHAIERLEKYYKDLHNEVAAIIWGDQLDDQIKKTEEQLNNFDYRTYQENLKSILLHEIQHKIQDKEGFAKGSNTGDRQAQHDKYMENIREFNNDLSELYEKSGISTQWVEENMPRVISGEITMDEFFAEQKEARLKSPVGSLIREKLEDKEDYEYRYGVYEREAFDLYQNTAGEIEAREVQKRMNMSPEERQANLPFIKDEKTLYTEPRLNRKYGVVKDSNTRYLNSENNPDISYSLSTDSQGNELSEGQKEFFKDSKVVDDNGNLLVLYHGTNSNFNTFRSEFNEFYFTDDENAAADYGGTIREEYLNLTNPYIVDFEGRNDKANDLYENGIFDVIDYAKENGYDGVIAKNTFDGANTHTQYVAFEPNQIKNINNANPTLNNDTRYSLGNNENLKEQQYEIVQKYNPMDESLGEHTWINNVDDIKTYQEALEYDEYDNNDLTPDFTSEMVNKALETGKVMVYSSYPIEQGTFVTPSKMEAESYAGNNQVYSKLVDLSDVAWIDGLQGQYAKVSDYSLSQEQETTNNLLKVIESYDDYLRTLPSYQSLEQIERTEPITNYTDETHGVLTKEDYKNKKIELFEKQIDKVSNKMEEQAKRFARQNLELNRKAIQELETIIDKYKGLSRETIFNSDAKEEIRDFVKNNSRQEFVEEIIDDDTRELQKAIRNTQLIISKENGKEFADGITAFKKNNPGLKIKYGNQNIDSVYQELQEQYPGMLEADVNDKDIPFILADVLKKQYKQQGETQVFELNDKEVEGITNRIFKGLTDNAVPKDELRKMAAEISQKVEEKYARTLASERYREIAKGVIEQTGLENIKDKKRGIQYKINTMKRNLRDIMSKDQAQLWYDTYFKPITIHNAQSEIDKQSYVERIQKFGLTNDESIYTQMLGEAKYNPESGVTTEQLNDFAAKHKIDKQKCTEAVEEFRTIYDELIERVNESLKANGYKEIEYRKGYFPHFIEDKPTSIIGKMAEKMGWNIQKGTLPTDIAGLTDGFKPGKAWTSFSQQRTGDATDYNALKGMDNYLRGAMDLIYHTEDIQKLRALENEIRYQYSEGGVQEQIDAIYADDELSPEEKAQRIAAIVDNVRDNPLGNLVTELRDYTNSLANKKSILDRGMEQALGRDWYSIMNNVNGRVSANMVGANISSAMTNFIPITQAWSQVSTKNLMRGMYESIKNTFKNDGFDQNSVYLTNRTKQADTLYQTGLDKINQKLGLLFEGVDAFTSNTIVRAKYYENLEKGMSEQVAIENADEFAKDVMAGRSKGDQPTIFNTKNPLYKMFTAFQLEVNNQYGYMFKDLPADLGDEAKDKLAMAFMKMFIGAWLYNMITEKITGRKAAFSPIDMAIDEYRTATDENIDFATKVQNIAKDVAEETPFLGGIMGGGRLPLQSAIPYENPLSMVTSTIEDIGGVFDEQKKEQAIRNLKKEWLKPVYFLALPFAGGQIKKTNEGLAMYNENLPIKGSYTNAGKLRFEADTSPLGVLQAAVFGQYASENAREYFAKGYSPLSEKQINEALDANLPIGEYREVNQGIAQAKKLAKETGESQSEAQYDYIYNLPISMEQKNSLINSKLGTSDYVTDDNGYIKYTDGSKVYWYDEDNDVIYNSKYREMDNMNINDLTMYSNRKDLTNYGDYGSLAEFNYANNNPEKYLAITQVDSYDSYMKYKDDIAAIKDNYNDGTTTGKNKAKQEVFNYINSLNLNKYQKLMLQKMAGGYSIKDYSTQVRNYINSLDLTREQKQQIDDELF